MRLSSCAFGIPTAAEPVCGYCADTSEVPEVDGITRGDSAEDHSKAPEKPTLLNVSVGQGYANYLEDMEKSDEQQRTLISVISAPVTSYERIQGPAAAGAGKTRCVTLGVAGFYHQFIATGQVQPSEVVVTTFTKVAASELISRLSRYLPNHALYGPNSLRIGTYHSRVVSQWSRYPEVAKRDLSPGIESKILGVLLGDSYAAKPWHPHMVHENVLVPWGVSGVVPLNVLPQLRKGQLEAGREAAEMISNCFEAWGFHSPEELRAYFRADTDSESPRRKAVDAAIWLANRRYGDAAKVLWDRRGAFIPRNGMSVLGHVWEGMLQIKRERNLMGFGDIMGASLKNAQNYPVRLFIVDEAQDNSWEQVQIAERSVMSGGRLVLLGDSRQNVYSFRGAAPEMFIQAGFGQYAKSVPITANYRSGWGIVELGNRICENEQGQAYPWVIGGRVHAARKTSDEGTYLGTVTASGGAPQRVVEEYLDENGRVRRNYPQITGVSAKVTHAIAAEIQMNARQKERGWRDFAVISRGNADLGMVELSLARQGVPARYARNQVGFLFRRPITRLLKLLALGAGVVTSPDVAAEFLLDILRNDQGQYWFGCLTYPHWKDKSKHISISSTMVYQHFQEHWTGDLFQILKTLGEIPQIKPKILKSGKPAKVGSTWTVFHRIAADLRPALSSPWPIVASRIVEVISRWADEDELYITKKNKEKHEQKAREESGSPADSSTDGSTEDEPTMVVSDKEEDARSLYHAAFLEMAGGFTTFGSFMTYVKTARNARNSPEVDAVTLTTGHSAKGLEWPVVFVICEAGRWPTIHAATEEDKAEERRILYVAVTRARDELHVRAGENVGLGEHVFEALYERNLLGDLEDKELEVEKARRLREVVCAPEGGRWKLYKHGVPFPCNGVYYWYSAEQAQMAYLSAYDDTLSGWVSTLIESLRSTPMWATLSQSLSDEALQELIMQMCRDDLAGTALGWTTLYSLISLFGYSAEDICRTGDVIEFSDTQGVMGYLVPPCAEEDARYYGRLELFKPFQGISTRRVGAGYTKSLRSSGHHAHSILDNSPVLMDARQRYVDYLHSLGLIASLEIPTPEEIAPTPVEPLPVEAVNEEVELGGPREEVIGSEPEDEVVDEGRYVRHMVGVTAPFSDTQVSSVCVLDMTRPDYPVLTKLSLAGFRYLREFALIDVNTRTSQKNGPDVHTMRLYQVVRTAEKDSTGRYKGKLVPVFDGGIAQLPVETRREYGKQQHDDVAACYLSDPRIVPRDQALLEGHFLQDMKLDFGRITTERGYTLISSIYVQETEQRLIGEKCPWFNVVSRNHTKYLEWNKDYITSTCGPVEPVE